jgi:uncharacterized membrane protein
MNDRLERLERNAARLAAELAVLQRELVELRRGAPSEPAIPPTSRVDAFNAAIGAQQGSAEGPTGPVRGTPTPGLPGPAKSWADVFKTLGIDPAAARTIQRGVPSGRGKEGLEALIGRYGTLALAVLTILLGVGAFLGWAIRSGLIGPELRVASGIVAAGVVAIIGWRMRQGASPRFGNVMLALALAIVHVVAWGAGPRLHLVASPVALGFAALASAVLAALAWREGDQPLFNVGFGGALLAPFVTSSGAGDAIVLLAYGAIVLGAGITSLRPKEWTQTPFVASAGVLVYTVAGADLVERAVPWGMANAPVIFALAVSVWATVMLDARKRIAVTSLALLSALGALTAVAGGPSEQRMQLPLAVALVAASVFAASAEVRGVRVALLNAIVIPIGALGVSLASLRDVSGAPGALTALLFSALSAGAAWMNRDRQAHVHLFSATLMAGLAITLAADGDELMTCLGIAAFSAAAAWIMRRYALPGVGLAGLLWLIAGTVVAFVELDGRTRYQYRPFLTSASLSAAAIAASWLCMSWHASRQMVRESPLSADMPRSVVRILGAAVAFWWVREELAYAWSASISAFLLAAYYAVAGVTAIFVGRSRGIPLLRQVGLALCVFAALTTILESSARDIGWKVASYILVGAFLLGVAYWYRVTGPIRVAALEEERQT